VKNIVEDVLIDGWANVNIITKNLKIKLLNIGVSEIISIKEFEAKRRTSN